MTSLLDRLGRGLPAGALLFGAVLAAAPASSVQARLALSRSVTIAPGVQCYTLDDRAFFGDATPISARLLEVAPEGTVLDVALGKDGTQGRDTVGSMAARRGAIAAVNAGFFGTTGDPAGTYKIDGLLISESESPRAVVGFATPEGPPLLFDRVSARPRGRIGATAITVNGIDTKRGAGAVVLYTPRYGSAVRGDGAATEWALEGTPLRVTAVASRTPESTGEPLPVPRAGFVLSASTPAPALSRLKRGDRVDVDFEYEAALGADANAWARADDIIGGAGLLIRRGRAITDWSPERLSAKGFVNARHPRTMIGRDADGDTWLVTVDGRQPDHSVGMTLPELTAFARRLGLVDALNLDGGGSTTMVVKGKVVNRPSDPFGARPVSDAIVVLSKPRG